MMNGDQIISSYIHEHRNECGTSQENTLLDESAVLQSNICMALHFVTPCRTKSTHFYIVVTCIAVELTSSAGVLSMAASFGFFEVNIVLLVVVSVGGMIIEWEVIGLIGIVFVDPGLLSCLSLELIIVGG